MTCSASDVFCDWLDVTYEAESPVVMGIVDFIGVNGGRCRSQDEKGIIFEIGDGVLKIDTAKKWSRISASGRVLAHFRAQKIYMEYLSELSMQPHTVSRLDAALDRLEDGADVIQGLRETYSVAGKGCALGRKQLAVTYMLGVREDGRETGTFYAGQRKRARTTARVYDKAWEGLSKRGERLPPTTRYEMTIRGEKGRAGPSLRDAAEPSRIFWHTASPTLLNAPAGTPVWAPNWDNGWHYEKSTALLPAEVLDRTVEFSPSLDLMIEKADEMGSGGRKYLLRLLERKLGLSSIN